jgi:hypothetical protein
MDETVYSNLHDALKDKNCKLTTCKLDLLNDSYTPEQDYILHVREPLCEKMIQDDTCILRVCEALKHKNCKLTQLRFKQPIITDQGLLYFCEALIHENCKLTELDLATCMTLFQLYEFKCYKEEIDAQGNKHVSRG